MHCCSWDWDLDVIRLQGEDCQHLTSIEIWRKLTAELSERHFEGGLYPASEILNCVCNGPVVGKMSLSICLEGAKDSQSIFSFLGTSLFGFSFSALFFLQLLDSSSFQSVPCPLFSLLLLFFLLQDCPLCLFLLEFAPFFPQTRSKSFSEGYIAFGQSGAYFLQVL